MTLYRENQNQHWGETNRMLNTLIDAKVLVSVDNDRLSRAEWEATIENRIIIDSTRVVTSDGVDHGPEAPPLKVKHSWPGHDGRYGLVRLDAAVKEDT